MEKYPGRNNGWVYYYGGRAYHYNARTRTYDCKSRGTLHCPGVAYEYADGTVEEIEEHICEIDEDFGLKKKMIQEMLRRIQSSHDPKIHDIFLAVRREMGPKAKLDYATVKSRLFLEARRSHPPLPVLLTGMGAALGGYEPFTRNFRAEITSQDGGTAILFTTDILLEELNDASDMYIDGTFKVCPAEPPVAQVYVIYIVKRNKGIGVIYILTDRKNAHMYTAIMTRISQLAPRLSDNLREVHGDFENAAVAAIRLVYPNIRFVGCWFHYCRANLRRLRSYNRDIPARFIGMVFALPLLPIEKFDEAHVILTDEARALHLTQFTTYYDRQWMSRRNLICVDGVRQRTNAHIENGNRFLRARFGVRPNLWDFIDNMNDLLVDNEIGLNVDFRPVSPRQISRDEYIRSLQDDVRNNQITVAHFLTSLYETEEEQAERLAILEDD